MYANLTSGRTKELNIIISLLSELTVIPFNLEDAKIASYIWAKLREKGMMVNDADILISAVCLTFSSTEVGRFLLLGCSLVCCSLPF